MSEVMEALDRKTVSMLRQKQKALCNRCLLPHSASSITCRRCLKKNCVKCKAPMVSESKHCGMCLRKRNLK